jgi:hypothetical protein
LALVLVATGVGRAQPAAPVPSFTFVAGGDIALVGGGANAETFAGIHRFLHGDLVFGNLEGTLAVDGSPKCSPYGLNGCFTFRADPSSAVELDADDEREGEAAEGEARAAPPRRAGHAGVRPDGPGDPVRAHALERRLPRAAPAVRCERDDLAPVNGQRIVSREGGQ